MSGPRNPHVGSSFDAFLAEEGLLEECEARALKDVVAIQVRDAMREQGLSKVEMARRMKTSRAQLDRLLDPDNASVTLRTLQRAAAALGKRVTLDLVDAGRPL